MDRCASACTSSAHDYPRTQSASARSTCAHRARSHFVAQQYRGECGPHGGRERAERAEEPRVRQGLYQHSAPARRAQTLTAPARTGQVRNFAHRKQSSTISTIAALAQGATAQGARAQDTGVQSRAALSVGTPGLRAGADGGVVRPQPPGMQARTTALHAHSAHTTRRRMPAQRRRTQ